MRADEDLPVANLAGLGRLDDRVHRRRDLAVPQHDLDLDLGQEIDGVFAATVNLGVALLRPKPLTSETVMPSTPRPDRASLTSSSLKGLMMASIFFMSCFHFAQGDTNTPGKAVNKNVSKSSLPPGPGPPRRHHRLQGEGLALIPCLYLNKPPLILAWNGLTVIRFYRCWKDSS